MSSNLQPLKLWMVEDSKEDFVAARRGLKASGYSFHIEHFESGDRAMQTLQGLPEPELPDLVLLDLNMPGTDGRDILQELKQTSPFKRIPIIILSTSSSPQDIDLCYQYGANSYMVKPVDFKAFKKILAIFAAYWSIVIDTRRLTYL